MENTSVEDYQMKILKIKIIQITIFRDIFIKLSRKFNIFWGQEKQIKIHLVKLIKNSDEKI